MSLVVLADGKRFEIEPPTGAFKGILRQRERQILPLVFKAEEERFGEIKKAFSDSAATETIKIYFPEEPESATDEQLIDVANDVHKGFTILGERREDETLVSAPDPDTPPEYKMQLTIEMGQRQYGE